FRVPCLPHPGPLEFKGFIMQTPLARPGAQKIGRQAQRTGRIASRTPRGRASRYFDGRLLRVHQCGGGVQHAATRRMLWRRPALRALTCALHKLASAATNGGSAASPYVAFINAVVVSNIRLLNPHSLSYQAHTFTRVPSETLVSVASKIDEAGLW